jgi:branched-chain amino acid transport system ATP-binding protein
MNNLILVAEKISKSFGSLQVLKEFSLEIYDGEVLGLIGPNGAGKSTFINIVCGILKPDEGRVLFMGRDITGYEPHRVTRLGVVKTFSVDGKSSMSSRLFR